MASSAHCVDEYWHSPGLYTRKYELKKAEADSHSQLPLFMLRQLAFASVCQLTHIKYLTDV